MLSSSHAYYDSLQIGYGFGECLSILHQWYIYIYRSEGQFFRLEVHHCCESKGQITLTTTIITTIFI